MFKVKLSTTSPALPLIRQTPGSKGVWSDFQFFVNEDIEKCDYWVVYEGLLKPETVHCRSENTIIILGEPPSIKTYEQSFISQFGTVVSCERKIKHPKVIRMQQGQPWHAGVSIKNNVVLPTLCKSYDEFINAPTLIKNRLISVIVSNKDSTPGHKKRLEFARRLKEHFGESIEMFGRGIREIEDKWDAIANYKYHIAIENSSVNDYWTEKLSDTFLCEAYPFYYGCPNIHEYFPENSVTVIDINNFEKSVSVIEKAIADRQYENAVKDIKVARKLVLDKHNLFPMICDLIGDTKPSCEKKVVSLHPESDFKHSFFRKILKNFNLKKQLT